MTESNPEKQQINTAREMLSEALQAGKNLDFTITSNSMSPLLNVGDIATIVFIPFDKLHKGDIIVVRPRNNFIVHRAVRKVHHTADPYFLTKGDNRARIDRFPMTQQKVIGKLIQIKKPNQNITIDCTKNSFIHLCIADLSYIQAIILRKIISFKKRILPHQSIPFANSIKKIISTLFIFPIRIILYIFIRRPQ